MNYLVFKRIIDVVLATLALLVFAPIILLVGIIIRWKLGEGVLFKQQRPGLHMQPFEMIKFRTMLNATDTKHQALSDAERLTPLGKWLRASSLDELPGLLNVIKGEMSLVGPRPLLMQYIPLYSEEQARRHDVRPGVTGLAQVNGRNAISWEEKFALDLQYVDNVSLWMDIKIVLKTVVKVFLRKDINNDNPNDVGMEPFTGTQVDPQDQAETLKQE